MEYFTNMEKLKIIKREKAQSQLRSQMQQMLESDDDIDLSGVGVKAEKGSSKLVPEADELKRILNDYLAIPFFLEIFSLILVASLFFFFTFVSYPPLSC
jgi:hypothetical protein